VPAGAAPACGVEVDCAAAGATLIISAAAAAP
jgi:hypothetical protein